MRKPLVPGDKFTRWTVIDHERHKRRANGRNDKVVQCQCDCGNIKDVLVDSLKRTDERKSRSCGCLKKETTRKRVTIHGDAHNNESVYGVWQSMIQRCYNPNRKLYDRYGGRQIKVCERWLNDYQSFKNDMGERPDKATLERIDNDGDYCPANCKWATRKEQCRNTSRNRFYTYAGLTLCLTEWSEFLPMNYWTLRSRIDRGMEFKDAISAAYEERRR